MVNPTSRWFIQTTCTFSTAACGEVDDKESSVLKGAQYLEVLQGLLKESTAGIT